MPQINVSQILFNYPSFLNTDQFKGMVVENNIENTAPYELSLNEKKKEEPIPESNWYNLDDCILMEKKKALSIVLNRELVLNTVCELLCTWSH